MYILKIKLIDIRYCFFKATYTYVKLWQTKHNMFKLEAKCSYDNLWQTKHNISESKATYQDTQYTL
jgi:hypothetical protein